MKSSAEKPDIPKTSESGVDNAVSLTSRPSEGRNGGDKTDQVILFWKPFLKLILSSYCRNTYWVNFFYKQWVPHFV